MNVKKYQLKYDYLKLELEDIENDLVEYKSIWNRKFSKYFESEDNTREIWVNEETGEVRETPPGQEEEKDNTKKPRVDKFKKLYRKLSMKVHPDHGGDEEDFLKAKKALDEENIFDLIELSNKYKIDFKVDEEDIEYLDKTCDDLEKQIDTLKQTLPYVYGSGGLQEKMAVIHTVERMIGYKIKLEEISDLL